MRLLPICVSMLLLSGCVGRRDTSRAWLVYVREVPVARVTLASASQGNVVDVAVRGGTADVTLRHSGPAKLERLHEPPGLKVALHEVDVRALAQGRYGDVERALEEASPAGADDLALALLRATTDPELARVAEREDGRRALARLYGEITSGSVWDDEREQAQRILGLWAQRLGPERFARAIEDDRTKIFPVRKSGMTLAYPTSPTVRLGADGLEVSFTTNVYQYEEWRTLQGMYPRVAFDEIVGVKLYDAGGVLRFVPALFLLEVSNAGERHTLLKCGEMAALGLTGRWWRRRGNRKGRGRARVVRPCRPSPLGGRRTEEAAEHRSTCIAGLTSSRGWREGGASLRAGVGAGEGGRHSPRAEGHS